MHFKLFLIRLKFAFGWLTDFFLIVWNSAWVASDRWLHKRQRVMPGITRPTAVDPQQCYCIQLIIQSVYYFSFSCARNILCSSWVCSFSVFFFIIIASIHSLGIFCVCVILPEYQSRNQTSCCPKLILH